MPLKVLIRIPNHLGDCIMALPMINEAREAHPGATVVVLAPKHLAELFEHNPAVDEIICIPSEYVHGLKAVMKIKEMLAPCDFDIGYVLPPSFGSAAAFKLGGVKERIGYITDGRRLLLSKPLPLPTPLNSTHRSELYFNLLRRATGADLDFTRPKLFLNDEDLQHGRQILSDLGLGSTDRFAVIAFRAVAESRRWGTENYTELVKVIITRFNLKVVLMGSTDDKRVGEDIAASAGTKKVINIAGKTTLREAAAILSNARFFVGNDSGPAHLAAAVGIPLVVLSGADDPKESSPLSPY
ncbi:MAG: lipopolysaccharide heptosyltransferase II, partial [Candidatus Zixiibacteriota bacterium]